MPFLPCWRKTDRRITLCIVRSGSDTRGRGPTHLVEASDDFSFPDVPDERSVTGRRPRDAIQVSFTEKQTRHQLIYTTQ